MKNPFAYLKHIAKDPVKTNEEADARKKEILPLLFVSIGVVVLSVILQNAAKWDFMSIFSLIGLIGIGFCGLLFMVIGKAKKKFGALTCDNCNTLAEITTTEDFIKYVSYVVEKDEARFHGYTGNTKPTDGVYSQVKMSGSASAVLSVELTCPHCGAIKHLRFSAEPFKCHAEAKRVGARQLAGVKASLEEAVKAAVNDYNNPDKKASIPYTFHSSKNPNFENRYSMKGANGAGAHPNYMGATIDYHKDVEEILEHYFVLNELTGTLFDPDAAKKKNVKGKSSGGVQNSAVTNSAQASAGNSGASQAYESSDDMVENSRDEGIVTKYENLSDGLQNDVVAKTEQASAGNSGASQAYEPYENITENTRCAEIAAKYEMVSENVSSGVAQSKGHRENKINNKLPIIIVALCALLVISGVVGFNLAKWYDGRAAAEESSQTNSNATDEINVNDYVGYWYITGDLEKELVIHSGSSDSVVFSLLCSGATELSSVSAPIKDGTADFSVAVEGGIVKGVLTFQNGAIVVSISQSTVAAIPAEEFNFTGLRTSSLMSNEGQTDVINVTEASSSSDAVAKNPITNTKEVPYLLSAEDGAYEIYDQPSFSSNYVEMLPEGTFTIVEEEYDQYHNLWGKLKSGMGWVCVTENTEV